MASGKVKWFNETKGFGFITPDAGGEELFAHYTAIQTEGFKVLKENQRVSYDVVQGQKGLQASHIVPE
jgi:CspA family cold shock protein